MHLLVTSEIEFRVFATYYTIPKTKKALIFSNFPGIWEFSILDDQGVNMLKWQPFFYFKMATIERSIVVSIVI
jgi:hypothetical protein